MAIGSTDLRDDQWHQIAVVLYPTFNTGQQVLFCIGGTLEQRSNWVLGEINTRIASSHGLWFGKDITSHEERSHFSRGAIDKVYNVNAALSQQQIPQQGFQS